MSITRSPIYLPNGAIADGEVSCDPTQRIVNADAYNPPGSRIVEIRLPIHRAEALADALDLLDVTADLWNASEHIPSGWKDVRLAIRTVITEVEGSPGDPA